MHPLLRLLTALDPADLRIFLPPVAGWRALQIVRGARLEPSDETDLEARDPRLLEPIMDGVRWLGRRWFGFRAEGLENVPREGPALLVGNHSGGLMVFDALLTYQTVWDALGPQRRIYGLGHDVIHWDPTLRRYAERFGALRAGHVGGRRALAAGHLVLVYPGSDFDSGRPWRDRHRIVLAGRRGFVRLALTAGVPVVPVVTAGAQEAFVVLPGGPRIARWTGLDRRARVNTAPLALSLPWGLAPAWLPYVPLPTRITQAFLPPLRWDRLGPEAARDQAVVDRCYAEIEAALQTKLDALTAGRRPLGW
jgi:1-acyl-sn-glycerol-3-phosphate acyltransferase